MQGRRRSELEALPSCEQRNSDGDLRSTPAGIAGVGSRAALATGSCEFFGEWKMQEMLEKQEETGRDKEAEGAAAVW
ncbi:hypothetical protein FQN60_010860 [Etheostoma spectabile]|uniref:Uncharacterized protein n=1 Tax=Etheostoma spectabile TaxID=54343 RepID=A0A5J5DQH3_9PERO|nr:hypothetical protein FQN60_010860 [Etheostoma spectabile]